MTDITCDLSRDSVCHFDGQRLDDVLLHWWGIPVTVGAFLFLGMPEIVVFKRNTFHFNFTFLVSLALRLITLVLESWALGSAFTYVYEYFPSRTCSDERDMCLQEPECLEEGCTGFEGSGATLDLLTVVVFAFVSYIPKLMAACARPQNFFADDFEQAFWTLVAARDTCPSGWILIFLPYIQATVLVLNTIGLGDSLQSAPLETLVRIITSLVIGALGLWTFWSICQCIVRCGNLREFFPSTVKILLVCQVIVDACAALLFLNEYLLGTFFVTADAVLVIFGLFTTGCAGAVEAYTNDDDASSVVPGGSTRAGSIELPESPRLSREEPNQIGEGDDCL